jgi:hypothetical protein
MPNSSPKKTTMHVVFIHGPPAAGKHTVGSILSELTGLPLFHNHLTVDLVSTLFDFGTGSFKRMREVIWLETFEEAAKAGRSFIFTFNPENTVAPDLIDRLEAVVRSHDGQIHYVELLCSDKAILDRIGNESRQKFGKLIDGELYQAFKSRGGFKFPSLPKPLMKIDTERSEPKESAEKIARAIAGQSTR